MGIGMTEVIVIFVILFALVIPLASAVIVVIVLAKYLWGQYKACPYCAEKIKEAAKVCRYCGRDVISV